MNTSIISMPSRPPTARAKSKLDGFDIAIICLREIRQLRNNREIVDAIDVWRIRGFISQIEAEKLRDFLGLNGAKIWGNSHG